MRKEKYVLALDQATINTGWALFEDGQLKDYGIYTPKGELEERIVQLRDWLENFLSKYPLEIYVAIEDIQLQNHSKKLDKELAVTTYRKLAWVQGVLVELLTRLGIPHEIVHSSSWKSTCGIKGADRDAQKAGAAQYVFETFNIQPKQDACDAICIGQHIINPKPTEFNWGL